MPTLVSASTPSLSHQNIYILLSFLGNFIILGVPYDYIMAKIKLHGVKFFNKYTSFIVLGVNYFIYIMAAVFSTNGV